MMKLLTLAAVLAFVVLPARLSAASDMDRDKMDDYLSRHITLWYDGEDGFIRMEDAFRDSSDPLVGRYGFEDDFLADRMEEVYRLVSETLGLDPVGFRVRVEVFQTGDTGEEEPLYASGDWFAEYGADYDHRSRTVYLDSSRLGPDTFAAGLTIALLYESRDYTPPRCLVGAALVTVSDVFGDTSSGLTIHLE